MRPLSSLPPSYFEARYRENHDPWNFAHSDYERQKYAATLKALTRHRYQNALEIGCSIGVFTRMLSERCDAVTALDVSETALHQCREHCKDKPNVMIERGAVPRDWPDGCYDLIIFSEVLYYLSHEDLVATAGRTRNALDPGAEILLVHWLGETDYPLTGNEAADLFIQQLADISVLQVQDWTSDYRLDLLQKAPAVPRISADS